MKIKTSLSKEERLICERMLLATILRSFEECYTEKVKSLHARLVRTCDQKDLTLGLDELITLLTEVDDVLCGLMKRQVKNGRLNRQETDLSFKMDVISEKIDNDIKYWMRENG